MAGLARKARWIAASSLRETPLSGAARRLRNGAESLASLRAPLLRGRRRGGAIVMYHGVTPEHVDPLVESAHVPADLFRREIRHLVRSYRVVPLAELVDRLESDKPVPRDWVALSFDDGFRNNLTCAHEILRSEGNLPWSLFVITDLIGTRATFLTTLLLMTVLHGGASRLRVPAQGGEWVWRELRSRRRRANCFWELLPVLKALPEDERHAAAEQVFAQLGEGEVEAVRSRFPSFDWLSWDEVRELHRDGVDIGGHTCTHAYLRADLGEERIEREILGCRERLEKELGTAPLHFCYPNGQPLDMCEASARTLRASGFRCALTTIRGTVQVGDDPFALRRLTGCVDRMGRFRLANATGWGR